MRYGSEYFAGLPKGKVLSRWMRLNWMTGGSGSEDAEGFITCGIEQNVDAASQTENEHSIKISCRKPST